MSNLNFQTKSEKFKFVSLIFLKKKLALPETETFSCFQIHDKWECFLGLYRIQGNRIKVLKRERKTLLDTELDM